SVSLMETSAVTSTPLQRTPVGQCSVPEYFSAVGSEDIIADQMAVNRDLDIRATTNLSAAEQMLIGDYISTQLQTPIKKVNFLIETEAMNATELMLTTLKMHPRV